MQALGRAARRACCCSCKQTTEQPLLTSWGARAWHFTDQEVEAQRVCGAMWQEGADQDQSSCLPTLLPPLPRLGKAKGPEKLGERRLLPHQLYPIPTGTSHARGGSSCKGLRESRDKADLPPVRVEQDQHQVIAARRGWPPACSCPLGWERCPLVFSRWDVL